MGPLLIVAATKGSNFKIWYITLLKMADVSVLDGNNIDK